MTLADLNGILANVAQISTSTYSEAAYVAQMTVQYTNELTSKQLSKSEFDDLMADLKIDQLVANSAEEQEIKASLQAYMKEILTIVSAIPVF